MKVNEAGGTISIESGTCTFWGDQLQNFGTIEVGATGGAPRVTVQVSLCRTKQDRLKAFYLKDKASIWP